jgi:hypothetical protein
MSAILSPSATIDQTGRSRKQVTRKRSVAGLQATKLPPARHDAIVGTYCMAEPKRRMGCVLRDVAILGASGFARQIAWTARRSGDVRVVAMIDETLFRALGLRWHADPTLA